MWPWVTQGSRGTKQSTDPAQVKHAAGWKDAFVGPGMLTISHEHQGTVSAQEEVARQGVRLWVQSRIDFCLHFCLFTDWKSHFSLSSVSLTWYVLAHVRLAEAVSYSSTVVVMNVSILTNLPSLGL